MAPVIFGGAAAHKSPAVVGPRSSDRPRSRGVASETAPPPLAVIYAPRISETQDGGCPLGLFWGTGLDAGWLGAFFSPAANNVADAADEAGSSEKTATVDADAP